MALRREEQLAAADDRVREEPDFTLADAVESLLVPL